MARWARRRGIVAIPSQEAGVLQRYGITRGEAERTALAVGRHGQRLEGAAALNRVLDEIGGGWRAATRAYRFWPIGPIEESLYACFARHRARVARFGVTPEC